MSKFHQSRTWQARKQFGFDNRTSVDAFLLFYLMKFLRPRSVLEIGHSEGFTAGLMMESTGADTKFDFVDITFKSSRISQILDIKQEHEFIQCSSVDWEWNRWYDFINVDGDHGLYIATKDIENSLRHLNRGGVIMVDDIDIHGVSLALDQFFLDRRLVPIFKGIQTVYCCHPAFKVNIDKFMQEIIHQTSDFFDWQKVSYKDIWVDSVSSKEIWIRHPDIFSEILRIYDL